MVMPIPVAFRARGPYYTVDVLDELPADTCRYELVHGELLVTPAPTFWHQELVARLFRQVDRYLERYPLGHVMFSPADVRWGRETGLQPDLFVIPPATARSMDWRAVRELLLVVEVLSPATARADRFTKRRRYQEAAVPWYWIVDPDACAVEVWTPMATTPTIERERVSWEPSGAPEPLVVELDALFRPVE